ncbi:MAG: ADP-ribosylglycohydrolase family protein [Mycobacterium sp.]
MCRRALLGTAAADALGAAYEFGPPRGPQLEVAMVGGGSFGWEPGEWTDDTSMAIAIAEVAASGADLRDGKALDAIVNRWHEWMKAAKDVGVQTSSVLRAAGWLGVSAQTAREASAALHERGCGGDPGRCVTQRRHDIGQHRHQSAAVGAATLGS